MQIYHLSEDNNVEENVFVLVKWSSEIKNNLNLCY